jgi:hypothetical protein
VGGKSVEAILREQIEKDFNEIAQKYKKKLEGG